MATQVLHARRVPTRIACVTRILAALLALHSSTVVTTLSTDVCRPAQEEKAAILAATSHGAKGEEMAACQNMVRLLRRTGSERVLERTILTQTKRQATVPWPTMGGPPRTRCSR